MILRYADRGIARKLTPGSLALRSHITIEQAQEAMHVFTSPDPQSTHENEDGIRLRKIGEKNDYEIVNWEVYAEEFERANQAVRNRRHYAKTRGKKASE